MLLEHNPKSNHTSSSNSIANQCCNVTAKRTTNALVCLVDKYECMHPHCVRARAYA